MRTAKQWLEVYKAGDLPIEAAKVAEKGPTVPLHNRRSIGKGKRMKTKEQAGVRFITQNPSWVEVIVFCVCENELFLGKLTHPIAGPLRNKEVISAIKKVGWLSGTNIRCPACMAKEKQIT